MPSRDLEIRMWAEACEMLDRAERLHRRFFQPVRRLAWEPPVDVFETDREFWVQVALPGVEPDEVEVVIDAGTVIVAGERRMPLKTHAAALHRLEIPYGRFERRLVFPIHRLELGRHELVNGCLSLVLRKL